VLFSTPDGDESRGSGRDGHGGDADCERSNLAGRCASSGFDGECALVGFRERQ
jgi:hypothetical protein